MMLPKANFNLAAAAESSSHVAGTSPCVPSYGVGFSYQKSPYAQASFGVSGCSSPDEAHKKLAAMLIAAGYTTPRWYEWWRWRMFEQRLPNGVRKHLHQIQAEING